MGLLHAGSESLHPRSYTGQQTHDSDKSSDITEGQKKKLASSTQGHRWAQVAYSSHIPLNCRLPMEHERGQPVGKW